MKIQTGVKQKAGVIFTNDLGLLYEDVNSQIAEIKKSKTQPFIRRKELATHL